MSIAPSSPFDIVSAIDQMDSGVFTTDPQGNITYMNRFLTDLFGDGVGRNACEHFYGRCRLDET